MRRVASAETLSPGRQSRSPSAYPPAQCLSERCTCPDHIDGTVQELLSENDALKKVKAAPLLQLCRRRAAR